MGQLAAAVPLAFSALFPTTAATAAGAAATTGAAAAAGTGLTSTAALSSIAAGAASSTAGTAAAGGLSGIGAGVLGASKLLAPSILAGALPSLLAPKPPKPPQAPTAPMPSQSGGSSFFGAMEGTANGTFGGNARAPQVAGGKKTLLGS